MLAANPKAIVERKIVDNHWQHLEDESLPAGQDVTVSLARWQAEQDQLKAHDAQVGIRLPNDVDVEEIYSTISSSPLIILEFPIIDTNKRGYHPDGKAYSQARTLRVRCGYEGEIRAIGQEVIGDVLNYMERCGINAFELREGEDLGEALARFTEFSQAYQAAAAGPQAIYLRRRTRSAA
ncbi:MAG: DUF934 domain-containing protein [Salinisphaeraceae bacterium]|nr:DUF934 domain-containing protein [Salinisphaeraceae bacterium]